MIQWIILRIWSINYEIFALNDLLSVLGVKQEVSLTDLNLNPEKSLPDYPFQHMVVLPIDELEVFLNIPADHFGHRHHLDLFVIRAHRVSDDQYKGGGNDQSRNNKQGLWVLLGVGICCCRHKHEQQDNAEEHNGEYIGIAWLLNLIFLLKHIFLDDVVDITHDFGELHELYIGLKLGWTVVCLVVDGLVVVWHNENWVRVQLRDVLDIVHYSRHHVPSDVYVAFREIPYDVLLLGLDHLAPDLGIANVLYLVDVSIWAKISLTGVLSLVYFLEHRNVVVCACFGFHHPEDSYLSLVQILR